jgi:hypothetical protein
LDALLDIDEIEPSADILSKSFIYFESSAMNAVLSLSFEK